MTSLEAFCALMIETGVVSMQMRQKQDIAHAMKSLLDDSASRKALAVGAVLVFLMGGFGVACAHQPESVTIERGSSPEAHADDNKFKSIGSSGAGAKNVKADEFADEPDQIVVDVGGAVRKPSVVVLDAGSRVSDAIERAGGLAADASLDSINRAALVQDGQKIHIPYEGDVPSMDVPSGSEGAPQAAGSADASSALVNINTADEAELDTLPGIGPATAQAIIGDRDAGGPFASPEDLMRVSGIGEKKFEKLKPLICV